MVESFFCVVVPFFSSLRDKLVLLFSLRFVVVVVLGFLFWYSRAFFYVLSLYFVLFVLGGNSLVLHFFVTLFLFFLFVFSVCFTVCFLHLCRSCRGLLLCSLCRFTFFFVVVSSVYVCLGLLDLIVWSVFACCDVTVPAYPLTPIYLFCSFPRTYRLPSHPAMDIRGHPCLISGPQPSIVSHYVRTHPYMPTMVIHQHPQPTLLHMLCFCAFCTDLLGG